jgi:hypothetical protein
LVTSQVWVCDFMKKFIENTQQYVHNVLLSWLKDNHFRICWDIFPTSIVLSVVDFAKNYTLQLQNEIQIQYYHSEKVNIMVHSTFGHGPDSNEQNIFILKEYHFYIRDDRCHDLAYVQHCFQFFYSHLKEKNIHMDQHWICSDGCMGQFKNYYVFQWLCMLQKHVKVPHSWNYFEFGHDKGSMMEQVHASKESYAKNKWNSQLLTSFKMKNPLLNGAL